MSLGEKIRARREALGMSQSKLGEAIGRDQTAVSRLENGDRKVSAYEVAQIADALGVRVRELLGEPTAVPVVQLAARVNDAVAAEEAGGAVRPFTELLEAVGILDQVQPGSHAFDAPHPTIDTTNDAEKDGMAMAHAALSAAGLNETAPVGERLPSVLTNVFGIDVIGYPMASKLDGLCVQSADYVFAVANSNDAVGRQSFTWAHELGHYLFADPGEVRLEDINLEDPSEKRANAFASSFLMPEQWVRDVCAREASTEEAVLTIMLEARTSWHASAWRLRSLNIVGYNEYMMTLKECSPSTVAYQAGRRSDWKTYQEASGRPTQPSRLVKRATEAFQQGKIGIRLLSAVWMTDPDALREELAGQGLLPDFAPPVDIKSLVGA